MFLISTCRNEVYRYVQNNPVNLVDLWGLDPYELFDTLDEAATDGMSYIHPVSLFLDIEGAAPIYQNAEGKYYYPEPTWGGQHSVEFEYIPRKIEGWFHSHGLDSAGYADYSFSSADRSISNRLYVPGYLIDPDGGMWKYNRFEGSKQMSGPTMMGGDSWCDNL